MKSLVERIRSQSHKASNGAHSRFATYSPSGLCYQSSILNVHKIDSKIRSSVVSPLEFIRRAWHIV